MSLPTLLLLLLILLFTEPLVLLPLVLLIVFFVVKKTRLSGLNWRNKIFLYSIISTVVLGIQYYLITFFSSDSRPPFTAIYMFYGSLFVLTSSVVLIIAKRMSKGKA